MKPTMDRVQSGGGAPIRPRCVPGRLLRAALLALLAGGQAAAAASDAPADLRVSRVAVFSSGVAYFECDATVEGDATAELTFRTPQINDIIKSMLVHDFDGGSIGIVSYASRDPVEKALRSFGVDITGNPSLAELLEQLRGEPVEISGDRSSRGVVLGVEKRSLIEADTEIEVDVVNVLTDSGVEQFRIDQLGTLRFTNDKIASELRKALETLAMSHDADKKSVTLHFRGEGQRKVRVAYLLEAPIWKTSYRLALREGEKPQMQGWATVENASEEDWNQIKLSLISGRPISFVMDLYTPLYVPRPVVELDLYASLRPPDYEGDMYAGEELMEARRAEMAGVAGKGAAPPLPASGDGMADLTGGRDAMLGYQSTRPRSAGGQAAFEYDADDDDRGMRAEDWMTTPGGVESVATAADAGELFEYTIATPVSIPRQHSAMLPIVNGAVEGTKVSVFNAEVHPKHPLNGLQLTNTTGLNLMQGPVTVFDDNVYAGDAKLPDLKPGEQRLIAYALDLGMEVDVNHKPTNEELLSVRIAKGTLRQQRKYVDRREYVVRNKTDKEKSLLIEQAYEDEWKLLEPPKPDERTRSLSRFRLKAPPLETVKLEVVLEQVTDQTIAMGNLGGEYIQFLLRGRVISPKVREALERVVALRAALDQAARAREEAERAVNDVVGEQGRIRENLRTLERSTDVYKRQLEKFDALETQIESLREKAAAARQTEQQRRSELEQFLLTVEAD